MTDEQTPKTRRETLWQAVGRLEGEVNIHKDQIGEIFSIQRQHAQTNAETATLIKGLAEQVKSTHTPETCPQKPKIDRMYAVYIFLAVLVAVLTATGLLKKIGEAVWNFVFH